MVSSASTTQRSIIAVLLFITPILFTPKTFESFEFPKMFFVYVLGSTIIFLSALILFFEKKKPLKISKLVWLFLGAVTISTVFSSHLYTSVWGYYTRFNGGLISVLVFFGLYVVFGNSLNYKQWSKFSILCVTTLMPIGTYAFYQHYVLKIERAYSTFGQPNWLAAYVVMLLPIILYNIINPQKKAKSEKMHLWIALYLLGYTTLWFTYSISGILGLLAGTSVFLILNRKSLKANLKILVFLFGVSLIISLANLGMFKQKVQDALVDFGNFAPKQTNVQLASPEENQHNVTDSGNIRRGLWSGTANLILSSPRNFILGTGPETFAYEFQTFRPTELNYSSEWDFVFNKPHNYYLEMFSNLGLIGLIPYFAILVYSIKRKDPLLTPAFVALYVTNIFGWPTVSTTLLFWFFLAGLEIKRLDTSQ